MSLHDMTPPEQQAWKELEEAEAALEEARQHFIAVTNENGGARRRPNLRVVQTPEQPPEQRSA